MRMPSFIRRFTLVRESATLLSGKVAAQVITLVAYLVITRLYTPADYALFSIFYSFIEIFVILSTCKYEMAVVVARDADESVAVSRFALRLNTVFSAVLLAVITVLYLCDALPGKSSQLGLLALLIPPLVFFSGTSRIYASLYNRWHRYGPIAVSDVVNALSAALFKIGFGVAGVLRAGMPLSAVLGQALSNVALRLRLRTLSLPAVGRDAAVAAAHRHRNFPLYVASKDLANTFSANLPFLLLAFYFDQVEIGLFALAYTFTFRPVNLLNSAFERVLYARAADLQRSRQPMAPTIWRFLLAVNAVALPIGVALWFFAEPLFVFCFSERWTGCGVYVRMLLPWFLLSMSTMSLMFIPNLFSSQRIEFAAMLVLLVLRVVALAVGIEMASFALAIHLFAVVSTLVVAGLLVWYLVQVRRYDRSLSC